MAITDDLRKTFSDPTPLYFAAGTADLALRQARKVPGLVEQLRAEAPNRIEAVRSTDPKVVQERATARVRETQEVLQNKVGELFGTFDTDLKKFRENAQEIALRGAGVAFEYAVKAREAYERVAEHGEQAVRTWRGEAAEDIEDIAVAVEPKSATPKPAPVKAAPVKPAPVKPAPVKPAPVQAEPAKAESTTAPRPAAAKKPAPARKTATRKAPTAKKTTPPAK